MNGLMVYMYIHEKEERSYMKSLHASASTRAKAKAFCRTDRSRPADLVVGGIAHYIPPGIESCRPLATRTQFSQHSIQQEERTK